MNATTCVLYIKVCELQQTVLPATTRVLCTTLCVLQQILYTVCPLHQSLQAVTGLISRSTLSYAAGDTLLLAAILCAHALPDLRAVALCNWRLDNQHP